MGIFRMHEHWFSVVCALILIPIYYTFKHWLGSSVFVKQPLLEKERLSSNTLVHHSFMSSLKNCDWFNTSLYQYKQIERLSIHTINGLEDPYVCMHKYVCIFVIYDQMIWVKNSASIWLSCELIKQEYWLNKMNSNNTS